MLAARAEERAEGAAVFSPCGTLVASWSGCRGRLAKRTGKRGASAPLASFTTGSPIAACLFCSVANRKTVGVICSDGSVELLFDEGSERLRLALPFPAEDAFALVSGIVFRNRVTRTLHAVLHHLEPAAPVARLSRRGRGNVLGSDWQVICTGGALALLWDGSRSRLALFLAHAAAERGAEQSYEKAVELSCSMAEGANSPTFFRNHVSQYDTFTVETPTAPEAEPQLYLRRLWAHDGICERPDSAIVSRNERFVYIRTGSRLRCLQSGSGGLWSAAFDSENVSTISCFGDGSLWMCAREGALFVCDRERSVAQVELQEEEEEDSAKDLRNMDEEGSSGSQMDCSPPVPLTASLAIRLRECAFDNCFFALSGSEGAARCALRLAPADAWVARLLALSSEALSANDLRIDYGETSLHLPAASDWDRFASLLQTFAESADSETLRETAAAAGGTPWQRLLARSDAVLFLSKRFRKEEHATRLGGEYRAAPAWAARVLPFELRISANRFRKHAMRLLRELHAVYEGTKADEALAANGLLSVFSFSSYIHF